MNGHAAHRAPRRKTRGRAAIAVAAACLAVAPACSDDADAARGVSGKWCGTRVTLPAECVGEDAHYAELEQDGATVTGRFCATFGEACSPLEEGTLDAGALYFEYGREDDRVAGDFSFSGDTLFGFMYSTACGCGLSSVTLHRVAR